MASTKNKWVHCEGHVVEKNKKSFLFDRIHIWTDDFSTEDNLYQFRFEKSQALHNAGIKLGDNVLFDAIHKEPGNIERVVVIGKSSSSEFQSDTEDVRNGKTLLTCKCIYRSRCDIFSCPFC